jgi:hypothetical protein
MSERIAAAALNLDVGLISLPPPARHNHLINACNQVGYRERPTQEKQGFVTSTGRFVGRLEAMRIAKAAGQLIPRAGGFLAGEISTGDTLFSEDVW